MKEQPQARSCPLLSQAVAATKPRRRLSRDAPPRVPHGWERWAALAHLRAEALPVFPSRRSVVVARRQRPAVVAVMAVMPQVLGRPGPLLPRQRGQLPEPSPGPFRPVVEKAGRKERAAAMPQAGSLPVAGRPRQREPLPESSPRPCRPEVMEEARKEAAAGSRAAGMLREAEEVVSPAASPPEPPRALLPPRQEPRPWL